MKIVKNFFLGICGIAYFILVPVALYVAMEHHHWILASMAAVTYVDDLAHYIKGFVIGFKHMRNVPPTDVVNELENVDDWDEIKNLNK